MGLKLTGITAGKGMPDRMTFSRRTHPTHGDLPGKEQGK